MSTVPSPVPSPAPSSLAPHERARPLARGSVKPARDLCSECGLCDSRWVAYVRRACAFLEQRFEAMEERAHGRSRRLDDENELYFGVHRRMVSARLRQPIEGAQWTGIVSRIGVRALETGLVDAVLCVQQSPDDRFTPVPVLARTPGEVLAARVNKPTLSPNLEVLEQLPGSGIERLLAIGVGCQIQALRAVQDTLPLQKLYVLGLPCVDNVSRAGLQTFLESASSSPDTVVHYEFMQDFRIHFRHSDGREETVPFFGLDTPALKDVFAPSCLSCFDYTNAGADLVVGYMGASFGRQWITVRNATGQELLDLVEPELDQAPVTSARRSPPGGAAGHRGLRQGPEASPLAGGGGGGVRPALRSQGAGVRPFLDRFPLHAQCPLAAAPPPGEGRRPHPGLRPPHRGSLPAAPPVTAAERASGVLLHPTALSGTPCCGSFGAVARAWIDLLAEHGVGVWQLLPLAPTDGTGSPYSSPSGSALNPWLIDADDLVTDGLITPADREALPKGGWERLDSQGASERAAAIATALRRRWADQPPERQQAFERWQRRQHFWLADHCRYMVIRRLQAGRPWWDWPEALARHRRSALRTLERDQAQALQEEALLQWQLQTQWERLRSGPIARGCGWSVICRSMWPMTAPMSGATGTCSPWGLTAGWRSRAVCRRITSPPAASSGERRSTAGGGTGSPAFAGG